MKEKTLAELSALIAQKEISSVELTQYYLDRIERLDGGLNSFISVTQEVALKQAAAADQKIAAGTAGPLTG
ncbi:MAG TPA: Asp-tRNA(Asn)/Glu-tRNA(Gln) amidotransferase GatCAB subunit A, partial [Gammaproteobacteria bacterium]|nr:Asp-tRNA(Asn)/Glu-tRNA(Gln) amidotransferase GatCAB subunit A [Gammaproteobacteria bacterium]